MLVGRIRLSLVVWLVARRRFAGWPLVYWLVALLSGWLIGWLLCCWDGCRAVCCVEVGMVGWDGWLSVALLLGWFGWIIGGLRTVNSIGWLILVGWSVVCLVVG